MIKQDSMDPVDSNNNPRPTFQVKEVKLIIGVLSCRQLRHRRQHIRDTWGKICIRRGIQVYFIVGKPGQTERIEGDRIIVDAGDFYEHLPEKIYRFFKFCHQHLDFDYLFKTDDDVYLRFPRFLKTRLPGDYCGHLVGRPSMSGTWHQGKCRDPKLNKVKYTKGFQGKWCGGPGYFVSRRAVKELVMIGDHQSGEGEDKFDPLVGELYEDKMIGDWLRSRGIQGVDLKNYYRNIHRRSELRHPIRGCSVIHCDLPDKSVLEQVFQQLEKQNNRKIK